MRSQELTPNKHQQQHSIAQLCANNFNSVLWILSTKPARLILEECLLSLTVAAQFASEYQNIFWSFYLFAQFFMRVFCNSIFATQLLNFCHPTPQFLSLNWSVGHLIDFTRTWTRTCLFSTRATFAFSLMIKVSPKQLSHNNCCKNVSIFDSVVAPSWTNVTVPTLESCKKLEPRQFRQLYWTHYNIANGNVYSRVHQLRTDWFWFQMLENLAYSWLFLL